MKTLQNSLRMMIILIKYKIKILIMIKIKGKLEELDKLDQLKEVIIIIILQSLDVCQRSIIRYQVPIKK